MKLTIVHRRHCPGHRAGPQGSVELRQVGLVDTGDVAVVRHPASRHQLKPTLVNLSDSLPFLTESISNWADMTCRTLLQQIFGSKIYPSLLSLPENLQIQSVSNN